MNRGSFCLSCCVTVNVTRLIRISYGDYHLQTIPPGMVLEVPLKPLEEQRRVGKLQNMQSKSFKRRRRRSERDRSSDDDDDDDDTATTVEWVRPRSLV
mmetsp:Transcript_3345/g.7444  ORF Transcript_3345/g.7444 Transcript_3345/m.7444 type:complete len:98 (+) Transcript_3345:732-1025(+)|eukprot:CAMPEP_0116852624 /NCGR_PEP_ID=MMETSP0418-20121206/17412_1 /TAXON_ID=1158023 /ORGANISM="Astrosyne radiata, Strain 13vi08-1A" /LENGTH=97 /DNA_ID=CAMNT_0004484839 /DNA_START=117 /DNA_END=410 /DNA_ORIENTATION=+